MTITDPSSLKNDLPIRLSLYWHLYWPEQQHSSEHRLKSREVEKNLTVFIGFPNVSDVELSLGGDEVPGRKKR